MKSIGHGVSFGLLIISAAFLLTGWVFSDPVFVQVGRIICAFVAGAIFLGELLLGNRRYASYPVVEAERRGHMFRNMGMWLCGFGFCGLTSFFLIQSWHIGLYAAAGMIVGSFVFHPGNKLSRLSPGAHASGLDSGFNDNLDGYPEAYVGLDELRKDDPSQIIDHG
jgi:hypothetical protein